MSNIDQELDEILLDKILLDTDGGQPYIKYTDEAVDALKALITTQKQELLDEIEKELPPDAAITKEDLGVDLARKSAANAVLGQVKSIITTKREE